MFDSIDNRGEFFSDHYLAARLANDLSDLRAMWAEREGRGEATARSRLRTLGPAYFRAKAAVSEASAAGRADAAGAVNHLVLDALGFAVDRHQDRAQRRLPALGDADELTLTAASVVDTPTGLLVVAVEVDWADDVDDVFDAATSPLWPVSFSSTAIAAAADVPGALFSTDDPPRFVVLVAGATLVLAERSKWAEGRFLAVDLDAVLGRGDTSARGELETVAALFSADVLVPGEVGPDGQGDTGSATADTGSATAAVGSSMFDRWTERSVQHAVGVSKELREGMRRSVEILANEVAELRYARTAEQHRTRYAGDNVDPRDLTTQCLRYLYRLIVLLYAESRPELGILPTDYDAYMAGYSLDRLRALVDIDLPDDRSRNGTHLFESLEVLFDKVNRGRHADLSRGVAQALVFDDDAALGATSEELYLRFPGLDAKIFDPDELDLFKGIRLRNHALQQVLAALMLGSEGSGKDARRCFISYAELGINQLGAVYEGLMAYSGLFATTDVVEVSKDGDAEKGTWLVPTADVLRDDKPYEGHVVKRSAGDGAEPRMVEHRTNSFVYRLSGRDRQRTASYYTPEVLTQCVVRHALAELLGTDDHAREPGGSAGVSSALDLLDLTVCEPALGSGAFANEAINQLAAEYLKRRQAELGEVLDAERYQRELQKVKAHFALHQTYGVDLNPTAVELAEVSLWLNCMHPGLKAPWFGLHLRHGNSLVGARRAVWKADQLKAKVWARDKATTKATVAPPVDRPLDEPLGPDEIHHFLLPGHGWGAVSARREAKELAPKGAAALAAWRKAVLAGPSVADTERLVALAAGVERLWAEAGDTLEALGARMRRPLDVYGTDHATGRPEDDRRAAHAILHNDDSALGRLRMLMDAWVGLWFWPVWRDETEAKPPTWKEWLAAAEALIGSESPEPTGQLDMFDDLAALAEIEARRAAGRQPTASIVAEHPWLARAVALAKAQEAWHWQLEFAPVFRNGGFDLQVGNPPWVRPRWDDDLTLAELDPWWGLVDKAPETERKQRREELLTAGPVDDGPEGRRSNADLYLADVAEHDGLIGLLGSPHLRPVLSGVQTNLYMVFMDTVWRHANRRGVSGLLHPESHFVDPEGGRLREAAYTRLRRHWQFANGLFLFDDIHDMNVFGVQTYGKPATPSFLQIGRLQHPSTIDGSLSHDGSGPTPGLQYPAGGWDLRPHRDRLVTVDIDVLADWARLFDEPGTAPTQARLLRPVTRQDLGAISALADQPVRLADHDYQWTSGFHEKGAKTDGTIEWDTRVPGSWDEVILQGPHFTVATPFAKQPNEGCKHNQDYSDWDLETLPERVIPRTNYQRLCDRDTYESRLAHWNGRPASASWRIGYRRMTQPGLERSLQATVLPIGAEHVDTVNVLAMASTWSTARYLGLWCSLPLDFLAKVSGKSDVRDELLRAFPFPPPHPLDSALLLRTLRLNCLTADYAPLWEELYDPAWADDAWTDPALTRVVLGDIGPAWTMATPLRRDQERRQALVELDALAAIMLGLTAEQLCAMYRTQFAVLRKYEYAMVFDAEGRKICQHHQSAGFRQARLQEQAKAGDLPKEWASVWKLVERWEEDPDSVDWAGRFTPPFTRVDREAEMTRAYQAFTARLDTHP